LGIATVALALFLMYFFLYWGLWKGGSWLVAKVGNLDLADPMTGRIAGSLIAFAISTLGVILTVLIRRWFLAQNLARSVELVEAHRMALIERKSNEILPNAVFADDLRALVKFLPPGVVLRVIGTARICERVYELSDTESCDAKGKIEKLVNAHLVDAPLLKVADALRDPFAFHSKSPIHKLTEGDLFDDTLF